MGSHRRVPRPDPASLRQRPAGGLTAAELDEIVARTCTRKTVFAHPGAARRAAFAARGRTGEPISAYRCPFSGGTRATAHWHIGHVPTPAAVERLALAIRHLAQGAA